jgi:hypothetical protein
MKKTNNFFIVASCLQYINANTVTKYFHAINRQKEIKADKGFFKSKMENRRNNREKKHTILLCEIQPQSGLYAIDVQCMLQLFNFFAKCL